VIAVIVSVEEDESLLVDRVIRRVRAVLFIERVEGNAKFLPLPKIGTTSSSG